MPVLYRSQDDYPTWIALIFIFNLIVGTGALTLPSVFAKAGYVLGIVLIIFLAFTSFMTVTFIIETIACANAVLLWSRLQFLKRDMADQEDDTAREIDTIVTVNENTPLHSQQQHRYYVLDTKIELGEMARLFFNDFGRIMFYICLAVYIYGDLCIYTAAVAKSVRDIICVSSNISMNVTNDYYDDLPCFVNYTVTRLEIYRLGLIAFLIIMGPFAFFNVQKTKYLQIITVLLRWIAFAVMIIIATTSIITKGPSGHPPAVNFVGLPALFGACVYSFMCHHSLPSLLAPIRDKRRIKSLLPVDFTVICIFYLLLAITGAFAFAQLEDLYTLNFVPAPGQDVVVLTVIDYFLTLFPVFTLSASYPIIAITLRNNLQALFLDMSRLESYNFFQRRIIFPIVAVLPPFIVTYFTENLNSLVSFTGSYAGTGIQYLIPIALVYSARKKCANLFGQGILNEYRSPFRSNKWLIFLLIWSLTCVILVTTKFVLEIDNKI